MGLRNRAYLAEGKQLKWGFDTTYFDSAGDWKKIIAPFNLKFKAGKKKVRGTVYKEFHWVGPGLKVQTGNNPITGEYNLPATRDNDKGYAGFIGITGDEDKVKALVKSIKKHGDISDESRGSRGFI